MRLDVDRRAFLTAAAAGLILPVRPALANLWPASGFTHSVASFNPTATAVTLWTRYVSADGNANELMVEVAADEGFTRILGKGFTSAGPDTWGTASVTVAGLPPGQWAWYRFTAPDKSVSPIGRTRTLPAGPVGAARFAVFSCANKPFGWFNAYGHCAARDDIDLVVHLGDYIYEYKRGEYPAAEQSVADRDIEPANEILAIDDYRQRYASYRVDPGLQALHRRFPVIAIWDDHEFANDAWRSGAQNHQADEGDWSLRLRAALTAHREWLPHGSPAYRSSDYGDLVSIIALDSRTDRDKQLEIAPAIMGGANSLASFRDKEWSAPYRRLLGVTQERWLTDTLTASVKRGTKWQFLAQQLVMGNTVVPAEAAGWLGANPNPRLRAYVQAGIMAGAAGIPGNMDGWGGYPAARSRLLKAAQTVGADLVVASGDSHNAWAFNLAEGGLPAGVEFAGQSVTSPGYESALSANPDDVRAGLVKANPEMVWCDTSRRGYMTIDFTPEATRGEWVFMNTIRTPSLATSKGVAAVAKRGTRRMTLEGA
ncbi:hypothetical protein IP88_12210 [alpha proteobacterium AAP81b]|nr:hypothetical protein IP88_12210 [alpha proteobacterium AAP81b]